MLPPKSSIKLGVFILLPRVSPISWASGPWAFPWSASSPQTSPSHPALEASAAAVVAPRVGCARWARASCCEAAHPHNNLRQGNLFVPYAVMSMHHTRHRPMCVLKGACCPASMPCAWLLSSKSVALAQVQGNHPRRPSHSLHLACSLGHSWGQGAAHMKPLCGVSSSWG